MTPPLFSSNESLRVLLAADVPRRREGGGAFIACNGSQHLESKRHAQADLLGSDKDSPRLGAKSCARRSDRHLPSNRNKLSIVDMHSPENRPALTGTFSQRRNVCHKRYKNHVLALPQ